MKVHGLKIVKTNFADEHFELVFSFQVHLSFHCYPQFSQINSSLYLYLHVIVGCELFIRHFHASFVNKIKRFLTSFRLVSTCIQLFRQRLSHKSVKAYATMPIGIMGRKSLALID